jgi:hypothetical protein
MSKEIKQNLFKFVTVRNPQLIDKKEEHPGFVFHPSEGSSVFVKAIQGVKEADKEAKLQETATTFSAYKTRADVSKQNEGLYKFSSWLMRNKNGLSYQAIKDNLNEATPIGNVKLAVWENLLYQTVAKKSVQVREALIQMLIADQFLVAFNIFKGTFKSDINVVFTDEQLELFTRRACASVVISKSLFSNEIKPRPAKPRRVTEVQERAMLKAIEVEAAKENVKAYRALDSELKTVEAKSNKSLQVEYDAAIKGYNASVDKILDGVQPTTTEVVNAKTGERTVEETFPDVKLPRFTFEKRKTVNTEELSKVLSTETMEVFKTQELGIYEEFSEVYEQINTKIKNENQVIIDNEEGTTPKTVLVGGVKTAVTSKRLNLDPYSFFVSRKSLIGNFGLTMFLGTGYSGVQVSKVSYTLTKDGLRTAFTGNTAQVSAGLDNTSARLFFPINMPIDNNAGYRFQGTFTLNNGVTLSFDEKNNTSKPGVTFSGVCNVVNGGVTISGGLQKPKIYGVTSLGIADFRRVEQEVCCYVPGEVSHIENIMAREYKERSTRSLTSIENTTEQTSEREIENLRDTTTTERNEMQSEVSSIVDEDKSKAYGANASVSGEKFGIKISAGGYFDASTSSSTSNSNSQAQSYAQEVTERAMDRVVQKVSKKRTSRILKEFEENNKHGFDNTKGDKHITGVYRWIDKIYKNKLINYGKRLMYEFAIPEPARFFKEAIYKSLEDGTDTTSAVILPEAPKPLSYYGIEHAGFLHEGNYQYYAAKYGAEVTAAPEYYSYVGTSLTKSQQGGDGGRLTNKAVKDVVKVPEGYKAVAAKTTGTQQDGHVQIAVAGRVFNLNSYNFLSIWPYYRDEVPVSGYFNLNWVTNVNILVKCERTDVYYNEWKNETYNAIIDAYNERLREYNEATIAKEAEAVTVDQERLNFNPLLNRSLEKRELKRIAIELLIDQSRVSRDNYNAVDETTGVSTVKKGLGLQNHAATVKFFEQAYDWEIMSYTFYPYFYAKEADWKGLFQSQDAADPIFQAFLQSGLARTIVPVRSGFEDAVNWYMSTGEIWNGQGLVTDQDDDLFVSIAEEMQTVEGEVEKTWETRLPTSLTVIQAGSIGLNVEGLPCNLDCDDFALFDSDGNPILDADGKPTTENPIEQTNNLIGGVTQP